MRVRLVLIGVLAAIAGGCVSNTNPVLKPEQLIVDPALNGKWVEDDKDQHTTLDVHVPGADKSAEVLYANVNKDDNKQHEAIMRLGKIKDLEVVEFKLKPEDRDHASQAPYFSLPLAGGGPG
ncbi:MAG TPA: hypothetical protein VHY37_10875 [Tepidisphaeraceae bacterium]|jgi:hypothetical protein|nr:hypothetical protein [Tepidisphaeraceae bacterium]